MLRKLFGSLPAHEFGPHRLRLVRDEVIQGEPPCRSASESMVPAWRPAAEWLMTAPHCIRVMSTWDKDDILADLHGMQASIEQ